MPESTPAFTIEEEQRRRNGNRKGNLTLTVENDGDPPLRFAVLEKNELLAMLQTVVGFIAKKVDIFEVAIWGFLRVSQNYR